MPKVKDCLGRTMNPYGDKTRVTMTGGSALDDTLEDMTLIKDSLQEPTASNAGGFTITISPPRLDYVGSRVFRYQTRLGYYYNKFFFLRINIVPDPTTIKNPAD